MHVQVFAEKAGLTGDQLRSVTSGSPDDACWTDPADRAVLHAADVLDRDCDLTDADWIWLTSHVGEEGAVDTLLICGWYRAISYLARATRLPAEPGAPRLAGSQPARAVRATAVWPAPAQAGSGAPSPYRAAIWAAYCSVIT